MTLRTIHLVRHGQYDISSPHGVADLGGSLTNLGREQANLVGEWFKQKSINNIFCSNQTRAKETAQIIAEKIHLEVDESDLLQESIPSIPIGTEEFFVNYMKIDPNFTYKTVQEHLIRSEKAFSKYFIPPTTNDSNIDDIVVCHGNIIRFFLCKALGVDLNAWINFDINHCGISKVTIEETGKIRVLSHNETQHIPSTKLSSYNTSQ